MQITCSRDTPANTNIGVSTSLQRAPADSVGQDETAIVPRCSRMQLGVLSHRARSYRPPYTLQARGHTCALSSVTLGGPLFSTGSAVDRGRSSCVSSRLGCCVVAGGRPGSGGRWLLVLSSDWFRAGPRRLISLQLPARARRRPREHSAFSPWQSANSFIYTYVFLNILQAGNDSETFCSFSIVPSALPPVLICLCPP